MANILQAAAWDKDKVFVLDTETTGLQDYDEVLSLSVVNLNDDVLFDELIKPTHRRTWVRAQKIHGITPEDVVDKTPLVDYEKELEPIFAKDNLIVGYNIMYDARLLEQSGAKFHCDFFDVMETFSAVYGELNEWKQTRRRCKLSFCANHYEYGEFKAHGSLADTKATAHCFKHLLEDEKVFDYWKKEIENEGGLKEGYNYEVVSF